MNSNEVSTKTDARLKRIKIVSAVFRILLGLYVVAVVLCATSCMMSGLPKNPCGPQGLTYFLRHFFIKPSPMPASIVLIEIVRLGLFVCGLFLLNRLFAFFGRGKFFAAENVRCVRWIGLTIVLDAFAVFLEALTNHNVFLGLQWLIGLFVVLLSWIADEGRKIQEEQELTV
jgi:DUF2975 family protein